MTAAAQFCAEPCRPATGIFACLDVKTNFVRWISMTQFKDQKSPCASELVTPQAYIPIWVKAGDLLAPRELADRWRLSVRTLDRWRAGGYGPAWLALVGRILYRLADVAAFEESQHRPRL